MELSELLRSDPAFHNHDWTLGGFIDTRAEIKGSLVCDLPVIGGVADAPNHEKAIYCVGVGDVSLKREIITELLRKKCRFVPIHPKCSISSDAVIGSSVLQHNVSVSVGAKVGNFVYLDSSCTIGHHVTIGDYSHIGRGVFIGGRSILEESVTVHPGALIANDIRVGKGATIGLGSVILRDVPEGAIVIGNPGRLIKG